MDSRRRSSIIWMFGSIGGALPLALTLVHLSRRTAFDRLDLLLWPACALLIRQPMTETPGLLLLAAAALLNILWYLFLGWLVSRLLDPFIR